MNTKKIAITVGVGISSLALGVVPAFADVTGTNDTTGSDSTNIIKTTVKSTTEVSQSNVADIYNNVHVGTNTGGNSANDNTGTGSATSGAATSTVIISNTANTNTAPTPTVTPSSTTVTSTNTNTGSNSTNKVKTKIKNKSLLSQLNLASIVNLVSSWTKTGHNHANDNTGGGTVVSGVGDTVVDVTTDVNHNN